MTLVHDIHIAITTEMVEVVAKHRYGDRWKLYVGVVRSAIFDALYALVPEPALPVGAVKEPVTVEGLFPNVDAWGAKEWFQRLVDAVRRRDEAVCSGDEIGFQTFNNIASSSASRLASEFAAEVRHSLATPPADTAALDALRGERFSKLVDEVLDMALYLHGCPDHRIGHYQEAANRLAKFRDEVAALSSQPTAPMPDAGALREALDRFDKAAVAWGLERNSSTPQHSSNKSALKEYTDAKAALAAALSQPAPEGMGCHGLDTPERVCFYEQDFYVLSNFSAFNVQWTERWNFQTSEHCYHWLKFATGAANGKLGGARVSQESQAVARMVMEAPSAHEAFKIAERNKHLRRHDWDEVKVEFMRKILRAKAAQHEYVMRKLLATGARELVENSWRDSYWGWGPNRDGLNMLGKLWMEIRADVRAATPSDTGDGK